MPNAKGSISNKTITLLVGIIVALFLFLSATLFNKNGKEEEALPDQSNTTTTQTMKILNKGATGIFTYIKKFR